MTMNPAPRSHTNHSTASRGSDVRRFGLRGAACGIATIALLACAGAGAASPSSGPATQASAADGTARLTWAKFPPEFADYYCTQGIPAQAMKPKPDFCVSDRPLLLDAKHSPFATTMVLDESKGTGSGYDRLYVDLQRNGKYTGAPVSRSEPFDGERGPDDLPVVAYFSDVTVPRQYQSEHIRVQVFLERTPAGDLNCAIIPQRWAVGTLTLGGRTMPVALIDTNWDGRVSGVGGYRSDQPGNVGPQGCDAVALGIDGERELRPRQGFLGQFIPGEGGSARGFLAKHMVLDSGTYELQVSQSAEGVGLSLAPAQVPMAVMKLVDKPKTSHLLMLGRSTCVMHTGEATEIAVPADHYIVMNEPHSQQTFVIKAGERKELDPLTARQRAAILRRAAAQSRPTGQPLSPDADPWARYVRRFVIRYNLQKAQHDQAKSILADLKARRDEYRTAHKLDYEAIGEITDEAKRSAALAELERPVDGMFEELKTRLMTLPTAAQRQAAEGGTASQRAKSGEGRTED